MAETDLSDLVDSPRETLEVELKGWMDLSEPVVRANLARHAAALANHGGGYVVFGFKDDLTVDPARPDSLDDHNRDTFSAIVKKYLSPSFQCEVVRVENKDHLTFPVVRVPGHGRRPVVARANGPTGKNGKVQGIQTGYCYVRKPGPESAPAITEEEWAPLIRRCVINDRDGLLRDFAALVQSPVPPTPDSGARLAAWDKATDERYLVALAAAAPIDWPVELTKNRYLLSYMITTEDDETIPPDALRRVLDEVNNEVRDVVWTGWSMFYPFSRDEIAPVVMPENEDGSGVEVLETNLIGKSRTAHHDFWRVSADGRASVVRAYGEDSPGACKYRNLSAGEWLSPETVLRDTTELVTHARLLSTRYAAATRIKFRCNWSGLAGRQLADFDQRISWGSTRPASADARAVEGEFSVAQVTADWETVVADLGCPVLRLFNLNGCGPELIKKIVPRFRKL